MKKLLTALLLLLPLILSAEQTVILTWEAPTINEDDTPLTDLAGFKIYCKTTEDYVIKETINDPLKTEIDIVVASNEVCVAIAFDTSNNESKFSNSVEFMPPSACSNLRRK